MLLPHYLATAWIHTLLHFRNANTYMNVFRVLNAETTLFSPKKIVGYKKCIFLLKQPRDHASKFLLCSTFCNDWTSQRVFCNVLVSYVLQSLKLSISVTLFFFSGHVKVLWVKVEKYHLVEPFFCNTTNTHFVEIPILCPKTWKIFLYIQPKPNL